MPLKLTRRQYAEMFGPTVGDQVRLADTELFIQVERDLIAEGGGYGNEIKFGGGKVIRDGMGQSGTATDAESLDLGRRLAPQHLAFGGGIHHCLGAVLARAEARAALGALVARFPGLALATGTDPLAWNGRLVLRGLDTLPVTFG